jgi:hypothetical protein
MQNLNGIRDKIAVIKAARTLSREDAEFRNSIDRSVQIQKDYPDTWSLAEAKTWVETNEKEICQAFRNRV